MQDWALSARTIRGYRSSAPDLLDRADPIELCHAHPHMGAYLAAAHLCLYNSALWSHLSGILKSDQRLGESIRAFTRSCVLDWPADGGAIYDAYKEGATPMVICEALDRCAERMADATTMPWDQHLLTDPCCAPVAPIGGGHPDERRNSHPGTPLLAAHRLPSAPVRQVCRLQGIAHVPRRTCVHRDRVTWHDPAPPLKHTGPERPVRLASTPLTTVLSCASVTQAANYVSSVVGPVASATGL